MALILAMFADPHTPLYIHNKSKPHTRIYGVRETNKKFLKFSKVVKIKTPCGGTFDPKPASHRPTKGPRSHPYSLGKPNDPKTLA